VPLAESSIHGGSCPGVDRAIERDWKNDIVWGVIQGELHFTDSVMDGSASTLDHLILKMFNITHGEQLAVNGLFQLLGEILGVSPESKAQYCPARPGDVRHLLADISKAGARLGYELKVDAKEGFARTVEWCKLESG